MPGTELWSGTSVSHTKYVCESSFVRRVSSQHYLRVGYPVHSFETRLFKLSDL